MSLRLDYWKTAPKPLGAMLEIERWLELSPLDNRLRRLVELRVSQINGCSYCCATHAAQARELGESTHRLDVLPAWREARSMFEPRELAALAWAEAVTELRDGAPQALWDELRGHFDAEEIAALTLAVTTMNAWNRVAIAFGKEAGPEEG